MASDHLADRKRSQVDKCRPCLSSWAAACVTFSPFVVVQKSFLFFFNSSFTLWGSVSLKLVNCVNALARPVDCSPAEGWGLLLAGDPLPARDPLTARDPLMARDPLADSPWPLDSPWPPDGPWNRSFLTCGFIPCVTCDCAPVVHAGTWCLTHVTYEEPWFLFSPLS